MGTKKSVMQHQFSQIPRADIPRSSFNRSHGYKTTFDSGYLVPFYVDEALPGDTFNCRSTLFARLATPIAPIMDNLFMETFYFAVPIRLIWENWQKFNGEQTNPGDSVDYLIPTITSPEGGWSVGTLSDYFGLPTGVANLEVSSLYHRAYNLIYNEWFRDENIQDSVNVPTGDGPDSNADYQLLRRGKRHDYFTSCLPWPQKGPGVELPVGGFADVSVFGDGTPFGLYDPTTVTTSTTPFTAGYYNISNPALSNAPIGSVNAVTDIDLVRSPTSGLFLQNSKPASLFNVSSDPTKSGLTGLADLSTATGVTINALRQAFQMQKLFERDARGGTRYTEIIRSHFGVVSPDARLQRPEYLGGSSTRVMINPVPQTASTDTTSPQGNLAAFGLTTDNSGGFSKSFVEHCVIIGLVNVRADLTYQQGINKMFSRQTRWEFYWPALAHLGEQAVLNKEIYAQGTAADDEVFGYQERYAEYRYYPSQITGKFRSTFAQSLDYWHLSQEFESLPTLSPEFIQDNPPVDRVIAVPSEPQFLFDSYINLHCARPMPVYSVPGLIDHF
nr:MAG: major capsid protein [Microvirus sp.]